MWPTEIVPDEGFLFMRVHKNMIKDGKPSMSVFVNHGAGMSTDWEKYSTPEQTAGRGRGSPENYGVVGMLTGDVRQVPGQSVVHTPKDENRARTDVAGVKEEEARMKLRRTADWAIHCPLFTQAS